MMVLNKEAVDVLALVVAQRVYGLVPLDDDQLSKCRQIVNDVIDTFLLPEESELEESYQRTIVHERKRVLALLMAHP